MISCMTSTITVTAMAFWKNDSFVEHVLQEISGACVDTEPRGIEATCIVSGDRERPHASLKNQASDQGQTFHVHVFTKTLNDGAKPRAH